MAGDHLDAIARMDDLIATVHFNSICYIVQARVQRPRASEIATDIFNRPTCIFSSEIHAWKTTTMRVQYSHSWTHEPDYDHSRVKHYLWSRWQVLHGRITQYIESTHTLSWISGWKFDTLNITIQQRLCEALYSARRTEDAGESLLMLVNTFKEVYMRQDVVEWISGEFSLVDLGTLHSVPSRFHATMSLHFRKQWGPSPTPSRSDASRWHTTSAGVGESNAAVLLLERCLGYCSLREYFLLFCMFCAS